MKCLRSYFMKNYVNCGKRCGHKINRKRIIYSPFVFVIVIIIWALTFLLIFVYKGDHAYERGIFGDMFGAVNALFSGLAFAGLIITLKMQREELKLQRKELNQTNTEFKYQSRI